MHHHVTYDNEWHNHYVLAMCSTVDQYTDLYTNVEFILFYVYRRSYLCFCVLDDVPFIQYTVVPVY